MNEWALRSGRLAIQDGYLDNLQAVYPVQVNPPRTVDEGTLENLRQTIEDGNDEELVRTCLTLDRFPIDDQYVAFLGFSEDAIERNPTTIQRIAERIRMLSFEQLQARITAPIQASRQTGPRFSTWLSTLGCPVLDERDFLAYNAGAALLSGSDQSRRDFANENLGAAVSKGLDCVAKKYGRYVIAEAKFISDAGGSQRNQFDSAVNMALGNSGTAARVAVLDGVVWVVGPNRYMHRRLDETNVCAMSALLFLEYLRSLS